MDYLPYFEKEYLLERRLHQLDSDLHDRFSESIFIVQRLLTGYLNYFPEFTNHSETHSLAVINYCNSIADTDTINSMNADELYILLMSCYLHDVGMGISEKDYQEFSPWIDQTEYFAEHPDAEIPDVIRTFHHDYSACFIQKYAKLFDIPSYKHLFAIVHTVRGHRKTDLFNKQQYPDSFRLDNGSMINVLHSAALIRIADELDVAIDRNSKLLFDPENASTEVQRLENAKHEAIKRVDVYPDRIILDIETIDYDILFATVDLAKKIQQTLDYCVAATNQRGNRKITQKKILINNIELPIT